MFAYLMVPMTAFCLVCLLIVGTALLLEVTKPEGMLVIRARVWLTLVGALGVWLFLLAA